MKYPKYIKIVSMSSGYAFDYGKVVGLNQDEYFELQVKMTKPGGTSGRTTWGVKWPHKEVLEITEKEYLIASVMEE